VFLACRDSLHAEKVAARPQDFVAGLTVRADRCFLYLLSEPRRTNDPHPALTFFAAKDFLHDPPLPELTSLEGPLRPRISLQF
jgi:hypothetical protein